MSNFLNIIYKYIYYQGVQLPKYNLQIYINRVSNFVNIIHGQGCNLVNSYTVKLYLGLRKVSNYFEVGHLHTLKQNPSSKNILVTVSGFLFWFGGCLSMSVKIMQNLKDKNLETKLVQLTTYSKGRLGY